eukprot:gene28763-37103_t
MDGLENALKERVANANAAFMAKLPVKPNLANDYEEQDDYSHMLGDLDEVAPIAFRMEYRGANGSTSERMVRLLKMTADGGDYKISAWCYHRNAYRLFLLSRVTEISDIATGEIFSDARAFFEDCGVLQSETPEAQAVRLCMNELITLSFVGACDGLFHPAEREEVVKHVFERFCEPLIESKVHRLVGSIAPDEKAFER